MNIKKDFGRTANQAALGARTRKTGRTKWFIGYKKHSLRIWFSAHTDSVLIIPLTSWTAPANRADVRFLKPSLHYLQHHLDFLPNLVLADMAYINMETQRKLRELYGVGVLTKLPPNYDLPEAVRSALLLECRQGQRLRWLGLHQDDQLHWFDVEPQNQCLCPYCWEQSSCPREFSFRPADHEIALGTIPLNTKLAQQLLTQSRSWIEATQAYEKIQLGLASMFLNSLRLTSIMCLLADTVLLLRAHAICNRPKAPELLRNLSQKQLQLTFE